MPSTRKQPVAATGVATASGSSPQQPSKAKSSKVKVVKPFLRGTAAARVYYSDIAALGGGGISAGQVQTVLEGLRKIFIRDLKSSSTFKLHGIV